jgi:hypothetical protein
VRFVVATHSYLLLVSATPDGVTDTRILDTGYFDGADVFPDGTIIACYKIDPWSKRSPTGFRFYDAKGPINIPSVDGTDILDPHQLTLDADNRGCWNTSTATNELVYKSLRDSTSDRRFHFLAPEKDQNWNHINSICVRDNYLYVMFHNWAREPTEVRAFKWDGTDIELLDKRTLPHYSCHNFEHTPRYFYYNASDNGCVVRGNWDTQQYDTCNIGDDWHPKGLSVADEYVVSGYSEHAVSTPRRFISVSGLAWVARESWEFCGLTPILLMGDRGVGNVNEVRYYP